jgi:3'-5' exoribonuclease
MQTASDCIADGRSDPRSAPTRSVEQLESELRELIGTVQGPHLRELLAATFAPGSTTWTSFRQAPAAKHYHQAYPHGLLEHSVTVAQTVSAISAVFGGIDRDVAVTGALLHDIGKLDAYATSSGSIEMTDRGRLHGEIALGYFRVRSELERIEGFPEAVAERLLHIILSHHGSLEHGSPVVPCTREAALVHMADNLGSRLGSFDRIERALADGERWAHWDKGIGAFAYFGPGSEPVRAQAA